MTLTTYDETLSKIIEPNVSTTRERFEVLKIMRDNGIPKVVWLSPILPFINDTEENIQGLLDYCIGAKVHGIICFGIGLTLRDGNHMEILVVRHGQSTADLEDRHEGRADYELTDLGCKQARCVANWVKNNYKIDIILSSTLKRAAKTAEFISEATNTDIIFDEELMEWNNGLLAGLLRSEANVKFPLPEGGRKPHDEFAESESFINFRARAEMFWSKFIHNYGSKEKNARICIVSHGGMINMLFRSFMMLPVNTDSYISTGDTGVHLGQ